MSTSASQAGPSSSPARPHKIITTPTANIDIASPSSPTARRRDTARMASPLDAKPKSPAARRMSLSSTPQAAVLPDGIVSRILERPGVVMTGILASTVLSGTLYSLIYGTALNTSINSHLPERSFYFARKSNLINQLFVKRSWGWTSLIYLLHLWSSPASGTDPSIFSRTAYTRDSRGSRLVAWLVASACWVVFTSWFFGAGLGDRVIELSGGACAVALPKEWGLDRTALEPMLPKGVSGVLAAAGSGAGAGEQLYLPVPASFCTLRKPLSAATHPDLFALLAQSSEKYLGASKLHPTDSHPPLVLPTPRWFKGFDISGHTFLLTLASMLLVREFAPSWKRWFRPNTAVYMRGRPINFGPKAPTGLSGLEVLVGKENTKTIYRLASIVGTLLLGLWVWMLLMTSVWFHNPPEKVSGLVLGLIASLAVHALTPALAPERTALRPGAFLGEDENAARRGEGDAAPALGAEVDANGKEKVE